MNDILCDFDNDIYIYINVRLSDNYIIFFRSFKIRILSGTEEILCIYGGTWEKVRGRRYEGVKLVEVESRVTAP